MMIILWTYLLVWSTQHVTFLLSAFRYIIFSSKKIYEKRFFSFTGELSANWKKDVFRMKQIKWLTSTPFLKFSIKELLLCLLIFLSWVFDRNSLKGFFFFYNKFLHQSKLALDVDLIFSNLLQYLLNFYIFSFPTLNDLNVLFSKNSYRNLSNTVSVLIVLYFSSRSS